MTPVLKAPNLSFEAEVVAVYEKDGRRVTRVLVHSFFLEIDAEDLADTHLGDTLVFQAGTGPVCAPGTRR